MKLVSDSVTRALSTKVLQLKKNSPHAFFGVGLAGVIGGSVLACRSTLKLEKTLDKVNGDIHAAKNLQDDKAPAKAYIRGAYEIGRLYAPAVVVGGAGVAALTGSHVQMTRRNNALMTTLALVSNAFEDYRQRVKEEIGEDRELELYRNVVELDGADGEKFKAIVDPNKHSVYARWFDETNWNYQKDPSLNRIFVQVQQNMLNDILIARGHVFLNEAYDALGFDRTSSGAVVGWVMGGDGDNHIDFGIFETANADFVNGNDLKILLDFNVDGVIYDKI